MDHPDLMRLEMLHMLLWLVPCRFHDLDAGIDDRLTVFGVRRRIDLRENRQVHAEGFVRHAAAAFDFLTPCVGRGLGQRSNQAQPTGFGHRGGQLGSSNPHHSALNDGVLDLEHFGQPGADQNCVPLPVLLSSGRQYSDLRVNRL